MALSVSLATLRYSIERKTRKYGKGYGFSSFRRNLSNKYDKKSYWILWPLAHKAAEATGD